MAFSQQFLDELRARVGLADVVGRRVRLLRKGREHSGLCPFHNEKTPSFTVNEEKGFYHCFGCGAHGSVIDFVMQIDKLTFPEAVERLAGEAGMEVPRASPADRDREARAKTLLDAVELACKFFERQLRLPEGKAAHEYLTQRGIREEMIQRFRLGFAPDGRGALKAHLGREGVGEELMIEAGLVIRPDDESRGTYDRFRGRVMFPILDARGRVIAFGGRVLGQGEPKYLNSPETPLFHKGFNLYGLAQALPAIREHNQAIVVEGYTDVIALHQAGIASAVAPLGTALTEDQMKLLWRHAAEPILCFDGDAAGQRAAARAAERGLPIVAPGKGLRFVELPAGEDPDTLVRSRGAAAMAELLKAARPLSDVIWTIETRGKRIDTPEARSGLDARFRELTSRITDETVRRHYQRAFGSKVWELYGQSRVRGAARSRGFPKAAGKEARAPDRLFHETVLVAVPLAHPALFDEVGERLAQMVFSSSELDRARQILVAILTNNPDSDFLALDQEFRRQSLDNILSRMINDPILALRGVRPDGDQNRALEMWVDSYKLITASGLTEDVQRLRTDDLVYDRGSYEKLKALTKELQPDHGSVGPSLPQGLSDENRRALLELKSRK